MPTALEPALAFAKPAFMTIATDLKCRLRLPIIGSPLFIISNPDLVIAQCKAGIVGAFPALNARPAAMLEEWLQRITSELDEHNAQHLGRPAAPFAVNQIVHRSNDRLAHDLEVCTKYKVPIVIASLGAREEVNAAVHSYGGIVFHDVINQTFARKAVEKGADGLIVASNNLAFKGCACCAHIRRAVGARATGL
jgi:nitronate monooxygenase